MNGMNGKTFYTSDLHIGHAKVAQLRGFASAEAHNAAIIRNWNETVSPDDTVWVLGDLALGAPPWLQADRLAGTKHLIWGNHDAGSPVNRGAHQYQRQYLEHFETVQSFARLRLEGHDVYVSHFPWLGGGDHTETERYAQYRLNQPACGPCRRRHEARLLAGGEPDWSQLHGAWLIHGHVHAEWKIRNRMINAGLDVWDMKPVPVEEIMKIIRQRDAGEAPERAVNVRGSM